MKTEEDIKKRLEDLKKSIEVSDKGLVRLGNTTRIRYLREIDILEDLLR